MTEKKTVIKTFKLNGELIDEQEGNLQANCIFAAVVKFYRNIKNQIPNAANVSTIRASKTLPHDKEFNAEDMLKVMRSKDAIIEAYINDAAGVRISNLDFSPIISAMDTIGSTSLTICMPTEGTETLMATWSTNVHHIHEYMAFATK